MTTPTNPLSTREMHVLVAMSNGRKNAEIGNLLYVTENTIKTHAKEIYRKLGAADRANAVSIAYQRGLLRTQRAQLQSREVAQRHASTCALLNKPVCTCRPRRPATQQIWKGSIA